MTRMPLLFVPCWVASDVSDSLLLLQCYLNFIPCQARQILIFFLINLMKHSIIYFLLGNSYIKHEFPMCCVLSYSSCVWRFATLWTWSPPGSSVHGILRQEYWNGLPCPPPVDLPNPGIEPESLLSPTLAGGFFTTSATWEAQEILISDMNFLWYSLNLSLYFCFWLIQAIVNFTTFRKPSSSDA